MKELQLKKSNLEFINLLKKVDKFDKFSDQDIQAVLNVGKFREYEENETVIQDGDVDTWVYLLLKGMLAIEKDNQHIGTLRRCGDMFGEMGAIDGSPRSATIVAKSKVLLLSFDSSVIEASLESGQLNFCYLVYRLFSEFLATRLRNTTEEMVKLKKENVALQEKMQQLARSRQLDPQGTVMPLAGKSILVVDAVETTRNILRSIMRDLKFKDVIAADTVKGTLKILSEEASIDMIVSDLQLGNKTGLDLLKEVRSAEKFSKIPFILLVNNSDTDKIALAVSLGANGCLTKPVNANMLHEKIMAAMNL